MASQPASSPVVGRPRSGFVIVALLVLALTLLASCRQRPRILGAEPPSTAPSAALIIDVGGTPPPPASTEVAETPQPAPPPDVYVHVSGAVKQPGVYVLTVGARACDALAAAGGPAVDAFLDAINLAALLVDSQKLHIPTRVEWERASAGGMGLPGTIAPQAAPVAAMPTVIDINTAGSAALQALSGIGPTLASRIIAYRATNGPFGTVDDLLRVSGIGPARLEEIRPYIRVGRGP